MLLLRLRTLIIACATVFILLVSFSLMANENYSINFPDNVKSETEQLWWLREQIINHKLDSNSTIEKFLTNKKLKAIKQEDPELLANTSYNLGLYYFNTENYIKAIPTLQSALDNVPNLKYSDSLLLYNNITIAFTSIRAFNSAVQYVGTLEYLIKKNPKEYALIKNNVMSLDGLYYNLSMYGDAIRIFREKRAAGINLVRSDPYKYAVDAFDFGRYFSANEQPDSALHYYQISRGIVESSNFENSDYFLGLIKGNMAEAFIQQQKFDEAIPLLKEHYVASLRVENLESSAKTLNILAYCEQRTGDIDNALRHLQAVRHMAIPKYDNDILYTNTLYLSQTFGLLNQYDSAYWYSKMYIQMTDSIAATRDIKKSAQLSVSVELRHKEQIMQKALVQMHKQHQSAQKNKQTLNWIIAASVLLAISFITVLVLLRQQSRSKQKLKELLVAHEHKTIEVEKSLHEKEYLLKEIHHRVKNNLQIVSGILQLQAVHTKDRQIKYIMNESQNRIKSMALIHQMLYQNEDIRFIPFKQYLQKLSLQIMSALMVDSKKIKINLIVEEIYFDVETAIPIGLIVNEIISNAIKYAYPEDATGQIDIWLKNDSDQTYSLIISDDGVGLPEDFNITTTKTLGLQLVNMLCKQLKSELTFRNFKGAEFTLKFKLQNKKNEL